MASTVSRNITRDSTKKHYVQTGLYVSATLTNGNNFGLGNAQWAFYVLQSDGSSTALGTSGESSITAGSSTSVSRTLTTTAPINYSIAHHVNLWTDSYITSASLNSATMQYGSKATPNITASFKGGYWRPDADKSITYTSNTLNTIYEQYTISSGVFYYKLDSDSTYQSISFTGASVTIPANTLTTGNTYNAYTDITVDDGTVVTVSMNDISTVDAVPTVTAVSPINTVLYGEVTFRWSYSVSTGTAQLAFDLDTSTDGSTWTSLVSHQTQTTTTYTDDINTSGQIYWRVRGYNQDDVASAWSEVVSFVNNIPPTPPVITSVTTSGRPTIGWSSNDQIAYQVQVLSGDTVVEDSGAVYSSGKQYQASDFLPDGAYKIRVRIYNTYGKVSDWAEVDYTQTSSLTAPTFTLTGSNDGVRIGIDTDPAYEIYYIKRNGVTVGSTDTGIYIDRYANGTVTYTVIGVAQDGQSAQSTDSVTFTVESNMLISTDGQVFYVNHRMNSPVGVSKQVNATYDQATYIGASLPEHHFAKLRDGRFTVTFKDYVDSENLLGRIMYYCDMYGNSDWVAVVSVGRTESRYGNETSAELQLTKYVEEIAYA